MLIATLPPNLELAHEIALCPKVAQLVVRYDIEPCGSLNEVLSRAFLQVGLKPLHLEIVGNSLPKHLLVEIFQSAKKWGIRRFILSADCVKEQIAEVVSKCGHVELLLKAESLKEAISALKLCRQYPDKIPSLAIANKVSDGSDVDIFALVASATVLQSSLRKLHEFNSDWRIDYSNQIYSELANQFLSANSAHPNNLLLGEFICNNFIRYKRTIAAIDRCKILRMARSDQYP